MKKILIPFDFGPVGLNAIKYAFELFGPGEKYVIVHVIDGNLSLNDPLTYTAGLTRGDSLVLEMNRLVDEIIDEVGTEISYACEMETGSVVESLIRIAENENFDVIVMGTRDKYDIFDKCLGTVSLGIVKRVKLPVYLVPKGSEYQVFKRVVVATDYHMESDSTLEYLIEWNKDLKADFHFVHIIDEKGREEDFLKNIVEEYFEKRDLDFPFTVIQKEKGNVADELIKYSDDKDAALQIFVTDKMSWFETMISDSVSKRMILKATKPMLFIPSGMRKQSQIMFNLATV